MTRQKALRRRRKPAAGSCTAPATAPPQSKSETLRHTLKRGQTPDEGTADLIVAGLGANAFAAMNYSRSIYGQNIDLTSLLNSLVTWADRVNASDLGEAEAILAE